jgi:hypothetical protein
LPDSGFAALLYGDIRHYRRCSGASLHGINGGDADASGGADSDEHTGVVEEVTVTTKSADNYTVYHCQRRALEDSATDEIPGGFSQKV